MLTQADDRSTQLRLVRDSVAAVSPPGGDLRRVRALRFGLPGFERATWETVCAMGWPALRVPEAQGGAGLGMAELCAVAEELGAGLVPEPFVPATLAARLLAAAAPGRLPALLAGEQLVLPAWQEARGAVTVGSDTAWQDGRLSGRKLFIPMAAGADAFLVVTPEAVALLPADAPGIVLQTEPTQDGGHFGTLTLDGVEAERFPVEPALVAEALDEATLATAATLLGLMNRTFALTLDFLRTRKQLGRPIGAFQALQHRAADLRVQLALTRASVEAAAATLDAGATPARRQAAVSRAKARATDAVLLLTRQAIQLHGGIGYTDEADIGLFLRRAMVLANQYGPAAAHRARYAAVMPEDEA